MRRVSSRPIDRKGFEHILKTHAVVGLFPHLLSEVETALGSVDVGVHAEGECLVDQQLVGIEVAHQEGHRMALFIGHLLEVGNVFAELNLVRKPSVRNSLVVEVHRPLVANGFEQ